MTSAWERHESAMIAAMRELSTGHAVETAAQRSIEQKIE